MRGEKTKKQNIRKARKNKLKMMDGLGEVVIDFHIKEDNDRLRRENIIMKKKLADLEKKYLDSQKENSHLRTNLRVEKDYDIEIDGVITYGEYSNPKGLLGFIERKNPEHNLVTFYEQETDMYDYSLASIWAGSTIPVYFGDDMWTPPKEWIEEKIDWEQIWIEMDFIRLGRKRRFKFYPQTAFDHAEIRFYD